VASNSTNVTITAGVSATFTIIGGGTEPTFQWQISTNNGSTWNNVTGGFGATTASYTTPFLTTNNNQNQFRCVVSVECGGGSTQPSTPATVTVNPSVSTPNGIVMNDTWPEGSWNNQPFDTNNSIWFGTGLSGGQDVMIGTPQGSATLWLGYFIDTSVEDPLPVHLDVGKMVNVSIDFSANDIVASGGNALRIGLFDYSDANAFVTADSGAAGSGGTATGVRGYMLSQNWGTTFNDNTPMEIYLRNGLNSANLMGSIGDFVSLGEGPTGATLSNSAAFQSGTSYTLTLSVARTADRSVNVSAAISGGGSNWVTTVTDTNYVYHRFDAFGIRAVNNTSTASQFNFTRFNVVVTNAPAAPLTSIPLTIGQSGNNVVLSWANPAFNLQAAPAVTGTYTNVPGATSPYTNAASGSQRYFRLLGQ
ncbi:MAG TPA: hypothetical protein PKA41_19065, partial [Verrucomicrobiota bacterium]|nr:hypothetical protein [Verrucomicrobiota bacterium]